MVLASCVSCAEVGARARRKPRLRRARAPTSAQLTQLLRAAVAPEATEAARRAFAQRWNGWVEQMTDPACPPEWVETAA